MDTLDAYLQNYGSLPGWFTDELAAVWDCLLAFQHAQAHQGPRVEIGVYHGKSAALTCLHLRADEQLVLVDPYRLDEVAGACSPRSGRPSGLHPCRSTQLPAAELQELHGRCRWVHVDGEHTGFACSHDLALADRLLDDRGLVAVDDFLSPRYPQVAAAVFNYLQLHPFSFRLFLCGFFKAYLARPKHAAAYLELHPGRDRAGAARAWLRRAHFLLQDHRARTTITASAWAASRAGR